MEFGLMLCVLIFLGAILHSLEEIKKILLGTYEEDEGDDDEEGEDECPPTGPSS